MSQIERQGIGQLEFLLEEIGAKKWLLVCDSSYDFLCIKKDIEIIAIPRVTFNEFSSNPLHDDADRGVEILKNSGCDAIVAVGGGSSIDVAKCIKMDSMLDVPLIAIPTTAGTGSESTRHIVVYRDGKKESLGNPNTIPNYIIFEPSVLKSLPVYQKKSAMLDALCQAIESWWSVCRTVESIGYSKEAITLIMENKDAYICENDLNAAAKIMKASNLAGKAINITATTAAHAMSYKITSMYCIPHGNAVAICFPEVWQEMFVMMRNGQVEDEHLAQIFTDIASQMGFASVSDTISWFRKMLVVYGMKFPKSARKEEDVAALTASVNPVRLKNNPIQFDVNTIQLMYERIVK